MTEFGRLLREARERAHLNQHELANKVGIDHSYISRIERGTSTPPVRDKVVAIADALEITDKAERFYFLAAAGSASLEDIEEATEDQATQGSKYTQIPQLPFSRGALHFPQSQKKEQERLLQIVHDLLDMARSSEESWEETIDLLESHVEWLRFRLEKEHDRSKSS